LILLKPPGQAKGEGDSGGAACQAPEAAGCPVEDGGENQIGGPGCRIDSVSQKDIQVIGPACGEEPESEGHIHGLEIRMESPEAIQDPNGPRGGDVGQDAHEGGIGVVPGRVPGIRRERHHPRQSDSENDEPLQTIYHSISAR